MTFENQDPGLITQPRRRNSMQNFAMVNVGISLCLTVFVGCNEQGDTVLPRPKPPISITYRDSIWGAGKVIQITNSSNHHLYNVKVVGRNIRQFSSASVKATDHLSPGQMVEVGWLEFESWTPVPGEIVEVYSDGYLIPTISYIPAN